MCVFVCVFCVYVCVVCGGGGVHAVCVCGGVSTLCVCEGCVHEGCVHAVRQWCDVLRVCVFESIQKVSFVWEKLCQLFLRY